MIRLEKNQKINLAKEDGSKLTHILFGLGWKEAAAAAPEKKGLLGLLSKAAKPPRDIDIDASVFLLRNSRIEGMHDVVFYNNRRHASGAVFHNGDNLVGGAMDGIEDSEQIDVDLSKVPSDVNVLSFVVNIYDCEAREQNFGMIRDAYIRIVDKDTGSQLAKYDLTDGYSGATSIIVGEAFRDGNGWSFKAIGEGRGDRSIREMMSKYAG